MRTVAKLIHQSNMTYVPTNLPVRFYGLPNGKVYLLYARFFLAKSEKTDIEFVLAQHEEFDFDYERDVLVPKNISPYPVYREMVDKPNPLFHILEVSREVRSYDEAADRLLLAAGAWIRDPVAC
jgi:hypothetical protein